MICRLDTNEDEDSLADKAADEAKEELIRPAIQKKSHLGTYVPGTSHPSVLQTSSNIQAAAKSLPKIQSTLDKSARLF